MHILTTYTHALVIKMLGCFDLKVMAKKLFANYLKRCIIVDRMYDVERMANVRNRYNQVPYVYLTLNTNW